MLQENERATHWANASSSEQRGNDRSTMSTAPEQVTPYPLRSLLKTALPEVRRAWNHIKAHELATYTLMKRSGSARVSVVFAGGPPFTVAIVQYVEDSSGRMVIDNSMIDVSNFPP